jgi:hypothetical protein
MIAFLNSALSQWIFSKKNPSLRIGGAYFSINAPQILSLPFKEPPEDILRSVNDIVDRVIAAKEAGDEALVQELEAEIDQIIYRLFDLTPEEIAVVENSIAQQ